MRNCILLFLSLSVVYSLPVQDWEPVENLVLPEQERSPLLGDVVPNHGHVVQENPKPAVQKESPVEEKQVRSNQVQLNDPVEVVDLEEQVSDVQEEVPEAIESQEQADLVEEQLLDEGMDQDMISKVQAENSPPIEMVEEELMQQEMAELPEEPLVEADILTEDMPLVEAVDLTEEELLMELKSGPEMQEVHQHNPNEYVDEQETMLEAEREETLTEEERNILQEEAALMEEGYLTDEEMLQELEYQQAERPEMQEDSVETRFQMDPVVESEALEEEMLMQDALQSEGEPEDPEVLDSLLGEAEEDLLINQQLVRKVREEPEVEQAKPEDSIAVRHTYVRLCKGVVIAGKCYQFFQGPAKAADAEYFCQRQFKNGHLASVTSSYIHSQMMQLMDRNGGRTRTWIGGLRYLDTGRFIWLDGEHWIYADWLPGEPNNTAGKENCVELLSNGKFNDMPCWDLRAYICSYPY